MEAWNTVKPCKKKGSLPITGRVSLGRRYEDLAALYYRRRGFVAVAKNYRWHHLEADLLLRHPKDERFLLVEVKGRKARFHARGEVLNPMKRVRLRRLAEGLSAKFRAPFAVEFLEIIGEWNWRNRVAAQTARLHPATLDATTFQFIRYRVDF